MQHRRLAVRGIIVQDNTMLAVRLKRHRGSLADDGMDYWSTPGGGLDIGESLIAGLNREMVEATGVVPVIGSLLYIQQFKHNDWEHFEFFFHITNAQDYRQIDLKQTTHGDIEIAEIGFIDPATTILLPSFLQQVDLRADVERGVTQIFNNMI